MYRSTEHSTDDMYRDKLLKYLHSIEDELPSELSNENKNIIYNIVEGTFEWIYINGKSDKVKVDYSEKIKDIEALVSSVINKNI